MDKDRVIGYAKVVKGRIKEAVGKAVGDVKLESEGKVGKMEGEVRNAVGDLKDTIRGKSVSRLGSVTRSARPRRNSETKQKPECSPPDWRRKRGRSR